MADSFDPDAPAAAGSLFGLPFTPEAARLVVVPVPWQATTSYRRGTREGPTAVLAASAQVDLFDVDYGDFWREGLAILEEDPEIRAWDAEAEPDALAVIAALVEGTGEDTTEALARVNALSERLNERVYTATKALMDQGKIPVILGGDHASPFGAIQALAERYPGMGILHIDAHADLRAGYEGFTWSHASIFYNVLKHLPGVQRLVQVGIRDVGEAEVQLQLASAGRVVPFFDSALGEAQADGVTWRTQVQQIIDQLPEDVYVSFDIDGLDPVLCPGTGTPVPGGLSFREMNVLLKKLSQNRRIIGFDLNEVGPGEWDGIVGARVLYKLCGAAMRSEA